MSGPPRTRPESADRAVQPQQLLARQRLGPRQQAPARSSTAAISRFSSSVSVRMRSVSISSISVPSKKSPGLSGATCG